MDHEVSRDAGEGPAQIRTFLIADVRGYTLFTQERGDEAAAKLAAKFAVLARAGVEGRDGSLIELRGDEALAVFASPRQAIRAAIDLQQRFVEETVSDPSLPLPVGIGLDAGEAVPVEGGYRGGALNLAARLCGEAGPGEILASREVAHLARRIDGVIYRDGGELSLKGLSEPVSVVRVVPEGIDPAERISVLVPKRQAPKPEVPPRKRVTPRRLAVAGLAILVVAAAVFVPIALRSSGNGLPAIDPNAAGIIDTGRGHITGQVSLGDIPRGIASGVGSVWVALAGSGSVARIDPKTRNVIQRIPVGSGPTGVAYGGGAVWVANTDSRTVSRINPTTETVVQTIIVGNAPSAITVGLGYVWVANMLDGTVAKVDPTSGSVLATIPVGQSPVGIAVGGGSVWVANSGAGTIARISPASNSVSQTVAVGNGPSGVVFDGHAVWVANSQDGTLSRIDATSGVVSSTVTVGALPENLAAGDGAVWAADAGSNAVSKVDPRSATVARTIPVTNSPQGLAVVGGSLWVAARGSAATHRGGTLRIVTSQGPASIDPNANFDPWQYGMEISTNDGLLTYAREGGAAGSALVPDLATSIPNPTDGGTTYTFILRRNIRFSDGTPLTATDVRTSFERVFTVDLGPVFYLSKLVGSDGCSPKACDLSRAITTDDSTGTVTFHLSSPDANFLDTLALPFASIVHANAPPKDVGSTPLPATGPYMIASYVQGKSAVLVRNPNFREWSPAAQPAGFADRIEFTFGADLGSATTDVEQGNADLLLDDPPADRLQEIATRYTAQAHVSAGLRVNFFFLNTRVAPFDRLDVRQALNYAVDRGAMAAEVLGGGSGAAGPVTCQALPPSFPGYAPYCPYTLNANQAGTWTAPDFAKAQALIDHSGTKGMKVTVWVAARFGASSDVVVRVLRTLGYRVVVKRFESGFEYFQSIGDSANRAQIGPFGWSLDTPTPSNIFGVLLSCSSFLPHDPNNLNASEFCDPAIDRQIAAAEALQATDPSRANTLWTQIDRQIVDLAPWVPFSTPTSTFLVSPRAGNYQYNPVLGPLVDQLWVG